MSPPPYSQDGITTPGVGTFHIAAEMALDGSWLQLVARVAVFMPFDLLHEM